MNRGERERLGRPAKESRAERHAIRKLRRQKETARARSHVDSAIMYLVAHIISCVEPNGWRRPGSVGYHFMADWLWEAEYHADQAIASLPPRIRRQAGL